jgi:hypothetical protein
MREESSAGRGEGVRDGAGEGAWEEVSLTRLFPSLCQEGIPRALVAFIRELVYFPLFSFVSPSASAPSTLIPPPCASATSSIATGARVKMYLSTSLFVTLWCISDFQWDDTFVGIIKREVELRISSFPLKLTPSIDPCAFDISGISIY